MDDHAHVRLAEQEAEADAEQPNVLVHSEPNFVLLVYLQGKRINLVFSNNLIFQSY